MSSRDVTVTTALERVTLEDPPSGELCRLWFLALRGWSRGARPWVGMGTAGATVLVSVLLHNRVFSPTLWSSGDVNASLPLWSEVARLPMSLFLPTSYLPVWAAAAQLLVVLGLGEMILGRRLTVLLAIAAHFASTLTARLLLDTVHGNVFGMAPALKHVLDTGPSAATTAVGACLLVFVRMNRCAALLSSALIVAALIAPGIDGVEHIIALACGVVVGVGYRLVISRSRWTNGASGFFKQIGGDALYPANQHVLHRRRLGRLGWRGLG